MKTTTLGATIVGSVLMFALGGCPAETEADPDAGGVTGADGSVDVGPPGSRCGRLTTPCTAGEICEGAPDCASGNCRDGTCRDVDPANGTKDGDETDVDCGGTKAPACADGKGCADGQDCVSSICVGNICQAPGPNDGIKNGDETGIDCGGTSGKKCADNVGCKVNDDCQSGACDQASKLCTAPSHTDNVKNGDETGVDCGGPTAPNKCAPGQGCRFAEGDVDCANVKCLATNVCDQPRSNDGIKNGKETDIDCGSGGTGTDTGAPKCEPTKICAVDGDCTSGGCNHAKKCAWARSCTAQHGGTTCGTGDATGANQNEDCCASAEVPAYTDIDGTTFDNAAAFRLDKYQITAGRIRKFLTAVNGNVQGWVQANRANVVDPSQIAATHDPYFPTGWNQADSADDCKPDGNDGATIKCNYGAINQVAGFRYNNDPGGDNGYGCYVQTNGYSTRTYYTTAAENAATGNGNGGTGSGESVMLVSKDRADEKSMTCTTYYILAAFCAWDGGRLETLAEYNAAYGGNGSAGRTYPWGSDAASRAIGYGDLFSDVVAPTAGYSPPGGDFSVFNGALSNMEKAALLLRLDRANLRWNYYNSFILDYRAPLQNRGQAGVAAEMNINAANDSAIAVAPPGRYPQGAGQWGHRDLLGNVMEITATQNGATRRQWSRNGSFETSHFNAGNMTGVSGYNFPLLTKYGRTGGRCARPITNYGTNNLP